MMRGLKVWSAMANGLRRLIPARYRPYVYLEEYVKTKCGRAVRAGPFAGMKYVERAIGSQYLPKLIGIYEREIAPAIEEAVARAPRHVLVAGAAEGYYAVGLALRLPRARVWAYEMDPAGRELLRELAALNGVADRVNVRGFCGPSDVTACDERALVICDCEGYEAELFTPETVSRLAESWVLIEAHEVARPGIIQRLTSAFAGTHDTQRFDSTPRTIADFPFRGPGVLWLPAHYREWAVSEHRSDGHTWLWFTPHSSAAGRDDSTRAEKTPSSPSGGEN